MEMLSVIKEKEKRWRRRRKGLIGWKGREKGMLRSKRVIRERWGIAAHGDCQKLGEYYIILITFWPIKYNLSFFLYKHFFLYIWKYINFQNRHLPHPNPNQTLWYESLIIIIITTITKPSFSFFTLYFCPFKLLLGFFFFFFLNPH